MKGVRLVRPNKVPQINPAISICHYPGAFQPEGGFLLAERCIVAHVKPEGDVTPKSPCSHATVR